jgi:hypothetical protein
MAQNATRRAHPKKGFNTNENYENIAQRIIMTDRIKQ